MANEYGSGQFVHGTHGSVTAVDHVSVKNCAKGDEYTFYHRQGCCHG